MANYKTSIKNLNEIPTCLFVSNLCIIEQKVWIVNIKEHHIDKNA
jgi:hypothetical protein